MIQIIDNFKLNSSIPIDIRLVTNGLNDRNSMQYKYNGLRVFDIVDGAAYVWYGNAWISETSFGIIGSGVTNSIPMFNGNKSITSSHIYQNGVNIGIHTSSPSATFSVNGSIRGTNIIGNGSQITNINANNISTGNLPIARLENGTEGYILTGSTGSPLYRNPQLVTVGRSNLTSKIEVTAGTTGLGNYYLTTVSNTNGDRLYTQNNVYYNNSSRKLYAPNISSDIYDGKSFTSSGTVSGKLLHVYGITSSSNVGSEAVIAKFDSMYSNGIGSGSINGVNSLEILRTKLSTGDSWALNTYRIQSRTYGTSSVSNISYIELDNWNGSVKLGYNNVPILIGDQYQVALGRINTVQTISGDWARLNITTSSTVPIGIDIRTTNNTSDIISFYGSSGGVYRGAIRGINSNTISLITTSDYRLKRDIEPMSSMLNIIKELKPSTFKFLDSESLEYGFIAQEVFSVIPSMRSVPDNINIDNIDEPKTKDGNDFIYGLDYSRFTPFLTKALQEVIHKLEDLTELIENSESFEDLKDNIKKS